MNSGIDNYRRTNVNIPQNNLNPSDFYKNMANQQIIYENDSNNQSIFDKNVNKNYPYSVEQRPIYQSEEIDPRNIYGSSNQVPSSNQVQPNTQIPCNNILSEIDLLEKDIHNIFTNNITPDRLQRLGSADIKNGMKYEMESLNPVHQMLGTYKQPDDLLHNNISKNTYIETLQEYTIIIDSSDRDIEKYINPFFYRVKFTGLAGNNDATIMKKFDHVKYIKLDTGVIPTKYYYVKQDTSLNDADKSTVSNLNLTSNPANSTFSLSSLDISGYFAIIDITDVSGSTQFTRYIRFAGTQVYPNVVDTIYEFVFSFTNIANPIGTATFIENNYIARYKLQTYSLANDKYTLLYIDEFQNTNENSTNDIIGKSFSVMFPDGCNSDVLYTTSGFIDKMFKFALLGEINQMTVRILDSNGNQLKNSKEDYIDYNINSDKNCSCYTDTNGYFIRNYACSCTYFRHPYYQKFQNTLMFRIGIIEPDIDKNIFS